MSLLESTGRWTMHLLTCLAIVTSLTSTETKISVYAGDIIFHHFHVICLLRSYCRYWAHKHQYWAQLWVTNDKCEWSSISHQAVHCFEFFPSVAFVLPQKLWYADGPCISHSHLLLSPWSTLSTHSVPPPLLHLWVILWIDLITITL